MDDPIDSYVHGLADAMSLQDVAVKLSDMGADRNDLLWIVKQTNKVARLGPSEMFIFEDFDGRLGVGIRRLDEPRGL